MISESPTQKATIHPNSLANLQKGKATRFKPGHVANPKGAPKAKLNLWCHVQRFGEMTAEEFAAVDRDTLPINQQTAYQYIDDMRSGDWQRIKEALDRDEGPIVKKVEASVSQAESAPALSELPEGERRAAMRAMLARVEGVPQLEAPQDQPTDDQSTDASLEA